MSAVIENRIVTSFVQGLSIPDIDVGTFLKEAFRKFADRTAIVSISSSFYTLLRPNT